MNLQSPSALPDLGQPSHNSPGIDAEPRTVTPNGQSAAPWWGRISLLWLMFVPVCAIIYTLCLPISPNDLWYHVRAGSIIATTGRIPTTNLFSTAPPWVTPDTPYFYQSWIAEVAFYKILAHSGLAGLLITRSLCLGLAYALVVLAAYRRAMRLVQAHLITPESATQRLAFETTAARLATLGGLLAFGMSALNMDVRPQTFSLPLFSLFTAALFEWPASPRARPFMMAALVGLMAIWANVHGAFFTGLIVLAVVFCGEALHFRRDRAQARRHRLLGQPLPGSQLRTLGLLVLLCLLSATLNQKGPKIYSYVFMLAGNEIGQRFIQEWQPPSWTEWNSDIFFASPIILLILFIRGSRMAARQEDEAADGPGPGHMDSEEVSTAPVFGTLGVRPGELLVLLALAVMAFRDVRSIVWYALFFVPAFSACGTAVLLQLKTQSWRQSQGGVPAPVTPVASPAPPSTPRMLRILNVVTAVFLLLMIAPALPWMKPLLPLPPAYWARFAPNPAGPFPLGFSADPPFLLDKDTPVRAAEFLRRDPPRGRLFNEMVFGSYLMWALYPQTLPSADPRIELYPTEFWLDYLHLSAGPPDAARILEQRGFSDALLNPELQPDLVKRLHAASGWHVVFPADPGNSGAGPAILFRRHRP